LLENCLTRPISPAIGLVVRQSKGDSREMQRFSAALSTQDKHNGEKAFRESQRVQDCEKNNAEPRIMKRKMRT